MRQVGRDQVVLGGLELLERPPARFLDVGLFGRRALRSYRLEVLDPGEEPSLALIPALPPPLEHMPPAPYLGAKLELGEAGLLRDLAKRC